MSQYRSTQWALVLSFFAGTVNAREVIHRGMRGGEGQGEAEASAGDVVGQTVSGWLGGAKSASGSRSLNKVEFGSLQNF